MKRAGGSVVLVLVLLHLLALNLWPVGFYGDDLLYVRLAQNEEERGAGDFLTYRDGSMRRYRPFTKLLLIRSYRMFGLQPTFIRAATGAALLLSVLCLLALVRSMRLSRSTGYMAAALFLIHQMPISVLYRNSRMEQYFTLAGLLALLAVEGALRAPAGSLARRAWLAVIPATLSLAFLWSEVALCFAAVVPLWALVRAYAERGTASKDRRRAAWSASLLAVGTAVTLLGWYVSIGAPLQGQNRYTMGLGAATIKNIVLAGAAMITPGSSIQIFRWSLAPAQHLVALALTVVLSAATATALAVGLVKLWRTNRQRWTLAVLCLGAAFVCLFPAILTQHIAEPYVYSSTLLFCLAVAILLSESIEERRLPLAVSAVLLLCVAGHVHASVQKIAVCRENGQRFQQLNHELERRVGDGEGEVVYLVDASKKESFGQFAMPMRLVYGVGAEGTFQVRWIGFEVTAAPESVPVWTVEEDGSIR